MIQANHPRFSCYSVMSLIIYETIFSGPLMTTDTPSGTVFTGFSDHFKITMHIRYNHIGYNLNVIRKPACYKVVNQITVNNYGTHSLIAHLWVGRQAL